MLLFSTLCEHAYLVSVHSSAVCACVPRHAAGEHPAADAEGLAYGASQDPHLCPWRGSELRAAPTHQAGGGQGPHQSCRHHRGLDPHRRGQHRWATGETLC